MELNLKPAQLCQINACQMYLQVTSYSGDNRPHGHTATTTSNYYQWKETPQGLQDLSTLLLDWPAIHLLANSCWKLGHAPSAKFSLATSMESAYAHHLDHGMLSTKHIGLAMANVTKWEPAFLNQQALLPPSHHPNVANLMICNLLTHCTNKSDICRPPGYPL